MEILSLGEKIKRRRKELDMTLKDLAGDRITPGQISLVESGKSNPSMDLLEYLATTLNTSIEYLMESEDTQAEKICIFYENLAESYLLNNDLNQGEQYIENALYYAEKYKLEYRKAVNLFLRANIHMKKGEFAIAQQFFLSANVIFIRNGSHEQIINTFIKLGYITLELRAYFSACSYFQQAEKVFVDNNIGNDFLIGEIYYYIAYTYFKLESVEKAINYSYLAREKFIQINNKKEYARTLLLLSQQYSQMGDVDNAIKYSQKTLVIFKEIEDMEYVSEIENNLGKLFYEFENMEESFAHLNKARELREQNNDIRIVDTLINLCENYIKLKDVPNSKIILQDMLNILGESDYKARLQYYLLKFRVDTLEGNNSEAEQTLHVALNFASNNDLIKEYGEIAITIGKYYVDLGNEKEAARYLNEGVDSFRKIGILKDF